MQPKPLAARGSGNQDIALRVSFWWKATLFLWFQGVMILLLKISASPPETFTTMSFSDPLETQAGPISWLYDPAPVTTWPLPQNQTLPLKRKNKVTKTWWWPTLCDWLDRVQTSAEQKEREHRDSVCMKRWATSELASTGRRGTSLRPSVPSPSIYRKVTKASVLVQHQLLLMHGCSRTHEGDLRGIYLVTNGAKSCLLHGITSFPIRFINNYKASEIFR